MQIEGEPTAAQQMSCSSLLLLIHAFGPGLGVVQKSVGLQREPTVGSAGKKGLWELRPWHYIYVYSIESKLIIPTSVQIEGEPTAAQQMFSFLNAGDWSNARDCAMRALEQMNNLSRGATPYILLSTPYTLHPTPYLARCRPSLCPSLPLSLCHSLLLSFCPSLSLSLETACSARCERSSR